MSSSGREPRKQIQTEKGHELFITTVERYTKILSRVSRELDEYYVIVTSGKCDPATLSDALECLHDGLRNYMTKSEEYVGFLQRTRTVEAECELSEHMRIRKSLFQKVNEVFESFSATGTAKTQANGKQETMSMKSFGKASSKHSRASNTSSSLIMRQKAKAEAAKKKLEFLKEESDLLSQKAEYEATCIIQKAQLDAREKGLSARKEAAVAMAELKVMEEEPENAFRDACSEDERTKYQLAENYVKKQNDILNSDKENRQYDIIPSATEHVLSPNAAEFVPERNNIPTAVPIADVVGVNANSVKPVQPVQLPDESVNNVNNNVDFTKFLLKKDLLSSRLHKFDDRPENYVAWKDTFKSVMTDISASASEELDLLLRYSGPDSTKQVRSIKVSNAGNPYTALVRAWTRLDSRYGSPVKVEHALKKKLDAIPKITYKDKGRMYELSDVLSEIKCVKEKSEYAALLSFFDTASGVNPTISKLPTGLQTKWRDRAATYKRNRHVLFPPFDYFCEFIHEMAETINDPSFDFEFSGQSGETGNRPNRRNVNVAKTDITSDNSNPKCIIHKANHTLNECRVFRHKTIPERKALLRQHGICFRCCIAKHLRKDCHDRVKCLECDDTSHTTAMHIYKSGQFIKGSDGERSGSRNYGEESYVPKEVLSKCTEICGGGMGKSCAKIVLVDIFHSSKTLEPLRIYAIIDEQSNSSLICSDVLDTFNIDVESIQYSLSSCGGKVMMSGRRADGFVVQSLNGQQLNLPTLIECDMIPNNRKEIPTPEVASHFSHLSAIVQHIPHLDPHANISLLIGRDLMPAHYVLDQKIGKPFEPYAQKLSLGWVIVGESCLNGAHLPRDISTMKTFVHADGRASVLEPCTSAFHVSSQESDLFRTTKDDNKLSISVEDQCFLDLMQKHLQRDENHNWVAPLPFKPSRKTLPNNREQAMSRAVSFDASLRKDPLKRQHVLDFMQALFDNRHAERAPDIDPNAECWYLPLFGVYHPQKRDKIRIVFDSSAKFRGVSLNDVLMTGPNLMNSLVGVLLRFRSDKVAVIADLQQMFYSFHVLSDHRDYLRFLWHANNDLSQELVEFRMRVHVFGNCPSPAVASCGLRKTADIAGKIAGNDVKEYIYRNFYVDDALSSHSTSDEAIDLLKRTQSAIMDVGNLRLHKICSNSMDVLSAFDKDDLAKELKELDLDQQNKDLPLQRSLGVCWDLQDDVFTYRVAASEKPFTRRGMLSVINGLYDPLGFAAPVTLSGRLLLREAMSEQFEWDQTLPDGLRTRFETWKDSLNQLENVQIPRAYFGYLPDISHQNLLVFTDASEVAVAAVAYIQSIDSKGQQEVRFVLGKAKLSPKHGHTIPRLELCAAVLGVEIYETIKEELDLTLRDVRFFTDSKITLGYIYNETKRFFVYVRNRVDQIRRSTSPEQWQYVPSAQNPADNATRAISSSDLSDSLWLKGPNSSFLDHVEHPSGSYPLVAPDDDCEVKTAKTSVTLEHTAFGSHRFEHFSTWRSLVRGISMLKSMVRSFVCKDTKSVSQQAAESFVLRTVQQEAFSEEISVLNNGQPIPKNSKILNLSPCLDDSELLRVGGRLKHAEIPSAEMNPIIIPKSHVSTLLIRHYHEQVFHQGRQFTENAIRKAGFWLIGGKRCVTSYIYKCVCCRKLRGEREYQKMANLPFDRLNPAPPFTYIGLDVFGPWTIASRKTRGGLAHSKRWALMITCLVVRAVHIEILEEMSSSCFINALRRFCAIRGEVKIIRSDCGTNFVGSVKDLKANVISVEDRPVKQYLNEHRINWIFNPPHASHMGGSWERMIGVARRIIDGLLLQVKQLTHEILVTFLAEVTSVINARPLVPISYDPDAPFPLSPSTLLTLKTDQIVRSFHLEDFNPKDIHKGQWKCIQHIANQFWHRWKSEFLPSLQSRKKWQQNRRDLQEGDIVLMCDNSVHRNQWPLGVIVRTYNSEDDRVRKVDVKLGRDSKVFTRPVKEVVLLLSKDFDYC